MFHPAPRSPFHGDCVEGLANAAAVAARCGVSPNQLHLLDDSHPAWEIEAFYLAALCQALTCLFSPQAIVLGGGVLQRACLYGKVRQQLLLLNNEYLQIRGLTEAEVDGYVVSSRFDTKDSRTSAGCIGALELARAEYHALKMNSG